MKNCLAVLFVLASCLFSAVLPKCAWAADPGDRYSDAFVLIQQGQIAEEKSDLATAYHKYRAALDTLHAIQADSPDWNAQMVEYRLKDCQSHFDAIKAKLPEPPPAPATEPPSIVSPAVAASTEQPAPLPPAPVVRAAMNDESAKVRAQADKLQTENNQLKSDLAEAKRAAKSSAQVDKLTRENKDLKDQLAATEKKAAAAKAAAPAESSALKKLRAEVDSARAEADKARKATSDLEKKNADLNSQVAAAKKQAADSADAKSADLKKLRANLDKARAEADTAKKSTSQVADLQKQNKDLSAQLASAKKEASVKIAPVVAAPMGDSTELKKLRADLDAARADAAQSKKNAARAADLEKENKDLSAKLAGAEKKANAQPADSGQAKSLRADLDKSRAEAADLRKQLATKPSGDSAEMKSLRAQLTDTRKELDQAKKSAGQVAELEKHNKDLSAKLADAEKKAATVKSSTPATVDTAELKKLREQLEAARADADKGKKATARVAELEKQNADLSSKLAAEKKAAATVASTEPPDARVMKRLRDENSYLRNLLDTYAAQNPELKGRLLRHDRNQSKSGQ